MWNAYKSLLVGTINFLLKVNLSEQSKQLDKSWNEFNLVKDFLERNIPIFWMVCMAFCSQCGFSLLQLMCFVCWWFEWNEMKIIPFIIVWQNSNLLFMLFLSSFCTIFSLQGFRFSKFVELRGYSNFNRCRRGWKKLILYGGLPGGKIFCTQGKFINYFKIGGCILHVFLPLQEFLNIVSHENLWRTKKSRSSHELLDILDIRDSINLENHTNFLNQQGIPIVFLVYIEFDNSFFCEKKDCILWANLKKRVSY